MSRSALAIAVVVVALAVPAASSAWQYTFHDFFQYQGGSLAAGRITAKKCNGGKLGTYDYRSFTSSDSGSRTELVFEITAELSVREDFRRMKHVEVTTNASPNFPPEIVDEVRNGLLDFHETVFTKYKAEHDAASVSATASWCCSATRSSSPETATTKFKPKPGC